jgi:glycosyltransferase involved in cell wall biosynthesis
MTKVLYVCHNHPKNRPGGAEIYAYELYQAIRAAGEFAAVFVAKVGPPLSIDVRHDGTRFALAGADPNDYFFHTRFDEFDRVLWSARSKRLYTDDWRAFLRVQRPDIVHFHHALFLGYDLIRETRRTLPDAAIVYTLHEFVPICQHNGQMIRRETHELCDRASPRRCHECFPELSPQTLFLRERFVKSAFEEVDLFVTPSQHARRRYIDWGIPEEKIVCENYGRIIVPPLPDPPNAGRRMRIGFIGQFTKYKGVDVLLEAMRILERDQRQVLCVVWGANLERTDPRFQERIRALLNETHSSVQLGGRYEQGELPALLSSIDWVVVPSIWWETGPLVIQEAMMHRRPVICSDIGSMIERIEDGVNGLHFSVGDPLSLADTIGRAVNDPSLWDRLRAAIADPHSMPAHLEVISDLYRMVLARNHHRVAA